MAGNNSSGRSAIKESLNKELALKAARLGTWELHTATNTLNLDDCCRELLGLPDSDFVSFEDAISRIHPHEAPVIKEAIQNALDPIGSGIFEHSFRLTQSDKEPIRWVRFTGQAYFDKNGQTELFTGIVQDVTDQVLLIKKLQENEAKLASLIEQAPVATCLFEGKDMKIGLANNLMLDIWGKGSGAIGTPLSQAIPELSDQPFPDLLRQVYETCETYEGKGEAAVLERNGILGTYYFDFSYKPIRNATGDVYAVMDMAVDVTEQVLARRALEESEDRLRSVIATAPAAIGLFVGRDLVVDMPNQAFIDIVGKGGDIVGKPLREVMPELENQAFLQILDDVFTSGKMYQSFGIQVDIVQQGVMTNNFYNITYSPLFDADGKVYAILDIAIDVTEKIHEQQKIEKSRMELLALFEQSPVAIAMIRKEDLAFTMANPFYGDLVGRPAEKIIGKPLLEALPELDGQGFDGLLRNVIDTGIPFISQEQPVELLRNNELETIYVDLIYQAQKELDGSVSGILVIATDVTQQVLARKSIQEAEAALRGAVELADLGTWEIDLETKILTYSEKLKTWFGIGPDEIITVDRAYVPVRISDRELIKTSITHAITPGTDGMYDVEYTLEAAQTGKERIVRAQGKAFYNQHGKAYKLIGSAQDVTEIRKRQLALEQKVQERTEELATANEEMAAINEEYYAINEELSESNSLLIKSNENLQKFAYIASHDLQEPLRKIQAFSDLIMRRHAEALGDGIDHLQRIQLAGKRMSNLIKDLLSFSRISVQQDNDIPVSLTWVLKTVLTDLDLAIEESGAEVTSDPLPMIRGEESQLGQLFQNLISNAIKFRRKDLASKIHISAKMLTAIELPGKVLPTRVTSNYHCIEVTDNGVGFSEQYAERIFEVFQRLHANEKYEGTGIGLAICERVAANHGGAISASSQPGKGATFSIYFPA
ncbi:PAS domain-containing sensor histidine kinase [Dyadobacter psychrotolerans]|uniref:histidine kinase n=1 Tax=Dyadobacter psychrotolerans TaxID=2541721 RepID=A0A4R5DRW0_9BACT|nr:PAS domain S-box protein [Dyadobacter psychrotolerans]TDE17162.1 PAS domain S-box protein [Dyadobacter psychrotolerans]